MNADREARKYEKRAKKAWKKLNEKPSDGTIYLGPGRALIRLLFKR